MARLVPSCTGNPERRLSRERLKLKDIPQLASDEFCFVQASDLKINIR